VSDEDDFGLEVYSRVSPVSVSDVGVCYYCGCEAEHDDFSPPKNYVSYYLKTGLTCSFAMVPSCRECFGFLSVCLDGLIEERKKFVNHRIVKKYKKALNIYERWDDKDLGELDYSLSSSIKAGLGLGEEAAKRLEYPGFEYEIDGNVFHARRVNAKIFSVFGEEFDNYRNAMQYAARSYKINFNILKEWLVKYDAIFDDAINAYFEFQEQERIRKKKNNLCREFSKEHKQNSNFVKGALDAYMKKYPNSSMEECLSMIYEERVKK